MISLSQLVHLLLILPTSTPNLTRTHLDELKIVLPDVARISVNSDIVNDEVVRLGHSSSRLASWIAVQVITSPDIIKVDGPELNIGYCHEASAKELFGVHKIVQTEFQLNPLCPYIGLANTH